MLNECKKFHNLTIFISQEPALMLLQEQYISLQAINTTKEKRCVQIKVRTCAYGSSQKNYTPREEAKVSIISLEALFA